MPKLISPAENLEEDRALARQIGARIRSLRLERGMTQQDLAGHRYTKAYISAMEIGSARPSMLALQHLALQLRVHPGTLLDDGPNGGAADHSPAIVWVRFARGKLRMELEDGREIALRSCSSRSYRPASPTSTSGRLDTLDARSAGRS